MTRCATWSVSKFQVKSESRTALLRVLENHRIQDKIESATEVASELRQRAWITTRYREECEIRANSMQALNNAKIDENALGYMKVSEDQRRRVEEVERSSEGTLSKEVRSSEGAVRQGSSDLPHERQGQGCSQETRWWSLRSAPGREAGGDQEESVGGPQDHRRGQESW